MVLRYIKSPALLLIAVIVFSISSCKVGPKYQRPVTVKNSIYRFSSDTDSISLADIEWITLFKDTVLHRLVTTGLKNNYDIRIAFARIEEARSNFKIERGKQFPSIGVEGSGGWVRSQIPNGGGKTEYSTLQAVGQISWEIDLWGKIRRSKVAARAYLFAQEAYQQSVRITLINEIVANYFDLLELDNEMIITRENITIREQSLELVQAKLIAGTASGLVVAQAEAELALAKAEVPKLEILIGLKENYLSTLLGEAPHLINRGRPMLDQLNKPSIDSPGLPSQLIFRRPDIIMAEQNLIAANANIGVARASMFPTLSVNGNIGAAFVPTTMVYNALGNLIAPIFAGGQLRAGVKKAQAQKQQMLFEYMNTVNNSLSEVSNSILQVYKLKEVVQAQQTTVTAAQTAYDLSDQLYNAGYASYLDVINAQSLLFESQIALSQAQSDELTAFVNLYSALGGGWK